MGIHSDFSRRSAGRTNREENKSDKFPRGASAKFVPRGESERESYTDLVMVVARNRQGHAQVEWQRENRVNKENEAALDKFNGRVEKVRRSARCDDNGLCWFSRLSVEGIGQSGLVKSPADRALHLFALIFTCSSI